MLKALETWFANNVIVVILPFLGALVAHLKEYERAHETKPVTWHLYGFFSRAVYACFAVFMVGSGLDYYFAPNPVPKQLEWFILGICSVRPDYFINWMFTIMTEFVERHGFKKPAEKKGR